MAKPLKKKRGRKRLTDDEIVVDLDNSIEELMEEFNHLQSKVEVYIRRVNYFNKTRRGPTTDQDTSFDSATKRSSSP